ncbi:unnamed protein product [Fusarium graminearum]|uniref:Uncharacterized protein n=1 Tax=Gibberella zeae TaxID=5518 RepID=A0A4U9EW57_GIBZA|nr:unnamed protein product [Fusarium graminearum]CAG1990935.1 unnamed protein product [Fusarium graminearum]CAG2007201.1 unnamed protein product [Fusarium graminearum]VTO86666.1 unnamed protein product [Fusarium graminearum]
METPALPEGLEWDLLSKALHGSKIGIAWGDAIYNLFVSVVQKARYDVEQQKYQREAEVIQHQQERARLQLEKEALQAKQSTADEALAVLITSLPECLQAVRTSIETGTSTISTKLDTAVNVFRDGEIHQRASRLSVTNSNDRVAGLVDHFSTTVDDENNDLVAGDTGYGTLAGLSNTFDSVNNKMANILIRFAKLDGITNAVDEIKKTLIAVQAGVCHIDILAKAINRIETSCGKLQGLPDAFLDIMSRLEALAASCGKLDGISKVMNRANDKLVEIETSSGDTAELAKISEAHQRKLAESVVNIDGKLVTKLTEIKFAACMRPTDAKINALKQAVDDLPSRSDLASEISRQLATGSWIDEAGGRSNGLGEEEERIIGMGSHRQNEMIQVTARLQNQLTNVEELVPRIQLEQSQALVRDLQEEVTRLGASLECEKRHNAAQSQSLSEQAIKLESEQKRAQLAEGANIELHANIADTERRSRTSADEAKALYQDLKTAWGDQKKTLEDQVLDKASIIESNQREIESMRSQLVATQNKLSIAEGEKSNVRRSLADTNLEATSLVRQLGESHGRLGETQKLVKDVKTDLQTAEGPIATLEAEPTNPPSVTLTQALEEFVAVYEKFADHVTKNRNSTGQI